MKQDTILSYLSAQFPKEYINIIASINKTQLIFSTKKFTGPINKLFTLNLETFESAQLFPQYMAIKYIGSAPEKFYFFVLNRYGNWSLLCTNYKFKKLSQLRLKLSDINHNLLINNLLFVTGIYEGYNSFIAIELDDNNIRQTILPAGYTLKIFEYDQTDDAINISIESYVEHSVSLSWKYKKETLSNIFKFQNFLLRKIYINRTHVASYLKISFLEQTTNKVKSIITGYGGFGESLYARHSRFIEHWVNQGNEYCIFYLKGGMEYGLKWYQEGISLGKINLAQQLNSSVKMLQKLKILSKFNIGIEGHSHGATLASLAVQLNPHLYKAALLSSGVYDFGNLTTSTHERFWFKDYGLTKYKRKQDSPISLVSPIQKTETLILTDENDQVVPKEQSINYYHKLKRNIMFNGFLIVLPGGTHSPLQTSTNYQKRLEIRFTFFNETL